MVYLLLLVSWYWHWIWSKNLGINIFPDPVGHFALSRRWGVADGEQVLLLPLGWYTLSLSSLICLSQLFHLNMSLSSLTLDHSILTCQSLHVTFYITLQTCNFLLSTFHSWYSILDLSFWTSYSRQVTLNMSLLTFHSLSICHNMSTLICHSGDVTLDISLQHINFYMLFS